MFDGGGMNFSQAPLLIKLDILRNYFPSSIIFRNATYRKISNWGAARLRQLAEDGLPSGRSQVTVCWQPSDSCMGLPERDYSL